VKVTSSPAKLMPEAVKLIWPSSRLVSESFTVKVPEMLKATTPSVCVEFV
jgi:hypothetical protein